MKKIFFLITIFFMCSWEQASAALKTVDVALLLEKNLHIPRSSQRADQLFGLYPGIIPGGYDGINSFSWHDKIMTLEELIVSLVRYTGWNTVQYDANLAHQSAKYARPEGYPWNGPAPTPRSIAYLAVALQKGLLSADELPQLNSPLKDQKEVLTYVDRLQNILAKERLYAPPKETTIPLVISHEDAVQASSKPGGLIIIPKTAPSTLQAPSRTHTILDLRSPNLRLYSGESALANPAQDYFPLGPLQTTLTVGLEIAKDSLIHQGQGLQSIVENSSTTAYGVGLWGTAVSKEKDAKAWAGFLNTSNSPDKDAPIVGLEIDVTNKALPGIYPNHSKVGMQIVSLGPGASIPGDYRATNAIEIISGEGGGWVNGLLFSQYSIHDEGTIIASSKTTSTRVGIDFSHTPFSDAAFVTGVNSKISFRKYGSEDAAIYRDDFYNGHLVLQAAPEGLRITNSQNNKNLLQLDSNGNLIVAGSINAITNQTASIIAIIALAFAIISILFSVFFWRKITILRAELQIK